VKGVDNPSFLAEALEPVTHDGKVVQAETAFQEEEEELQ
jgi:hypothetical protein